MVKVDRHPKVGPDHDNRDLRDHDLRGACPQAGTQAGASALGGAAMIIIISQSRRPQVTLEADLSRWHWHGPRNNLTTARWGVHILHIFGMVRIFAYFLAYFP